MGQGVRAAHERLARRRSASMGPAPPMRAEIFAFIDLHPRKQQAVPSAGDASMIS